MLYKYLKRFGVLNVTIAISLVSILFSNLIMTLFDAISLMTGAGFPPYVISTAIPAIIAPVLIYLILRLVVKINLAEERLIALSITDELTGAYNRRHFMDIATHEQAKAQRYGGVFSIAILDLDDFKNINDTYGHLMGDQVLVQVAKICQENIRLPDIFARYGGDEFVFLFSTTRKEQAYLCLERILEKISDSSVQQDNCKVKIRVSIGLAEYSDKGFLIDDVLREADAALYLAKRSGKNKIVLSTTTKETVAANRINSMR